MEKNIRTTLLNIVLSIVVATMLIPGIGIVSADDNWPGECNKTTPLIKTGTFSGSLSPNDEDVFRVNLNKGDYASIHLVYTPPASPSKRPPAVEAPLDIEVQRAAVTSKTGGVLNDVRGVKENSGDIRLLKREIEFRVYAERNAPPCIRILTKEKTAGEWRMALTINDLKPPKVGTEAIKSQQQLDQRLRQLERRVTELERQVEPLSSPTAVANNSSSSILQ